MALVKWTLDFLSFSSTTAFWTTTWGRHWRHIRWLLRNTSFKLYGAKTFNPQSHILWLRHYHGHEGNQNSRPEWAWALYGASNNLQSWKGKGLTETTRGRERYFAGHQAIKYCENHLLCEIGNLQLIPRGLKAAYIPSSTQIDSCNCFLHRAENLESSK